MQEHPFAQLVQRDTTQLLVHLVVLHAMLANIVLLVQYLAHYAQ
jgi:hypothetical protein